MPKTRSPNVNAWLTQIILNHKTRRMPFDSHQTHQFLTLATNSNQYLWAHPRPGMIIVQSEKPLATTETERIASQVYAKHITFDYQEGDRLEFAGIVSPTKAVFQRGKRGKKIPRPLDEIPEWLATRFHGAATITPPLTIDTMSPSRGYRPDKTRVTHNRVSVHGHMTVTDPNQLATILKTGVGPGKRFGTGLIQTHKKEGHNDHSDQTYSHHGRGTTN